MCVAALIFCTEPLAELTDATHLPDAGLQEGLNSLFWEKHATADGGGFFYSPLCGELMRGKRVGSELVMASHVMTGGFLCEEVSCSD